MPLLNTATRAMLCLAVLALTAAVHGILPEIVDSDINQTIENHLARGHATPNDMFTEVEQLMEDTPQKLEDTVHQMDNESARSGLHPHDPPSHPDEPPSHPEGKSTEAAPNNQSLSAAESIDKETDNRTDTQPSSQENNIDHECVIDEDCEKGRYCLYATDRSRCLPCKQVDTPCSKDEECCAGHLCVWGQCSPNATRGEPGSICQRQKDCGPDLCCAFHKALLFPVCSSRPIERERCYGSSNHLMALLSWDLEGEGPTEHCPCAGELRCQPLGRGSMCLKGQNSSEEEMTDALYSEIDYIV